MNNGETDGRGDYLYAAVLPGFAPRPSAFWMNKGVSYREFDDATFSKQLRGEMVQRAGGRSTFPADLHR